MRHQIIGRLRLANGKIAPVTFRSIEYKSKNLAEKRRDERNFLHPDYEYKTIEVDK